MNSKPNNLALMVMSTLAVNTVALIIAGCVICIQNCFNIFKDK